jgi:hypothetical protein
MRGTRAQAANKAIAGRRSRKEFDYRSDAIGILCLEKASQSKAKTGFGAVLVDKDTVITSARNRRSNPGENDLLQGGVDYAIHAEQAAILEALQSGQDVAGKDIYVLGQVQRGEDKGRLSVRSNNRDHAFTCLRCARTLAKFDVNVNIPMPSGWKRLSPKEALESATEFKAEGRKREFREVSVS